VALTAWAANTAYTVGNKRKPTNAANRFWLECTTAGTSHATTEPTWAYVYGNTITDGTAVWTYRGGGDGFTFGAAAPAADRAYSILNTYAAGNPNAIAAGDVCCIANETYSPTVALVSPIAGTAGKHVVHVAVSTTTGLPLPTPGSAFWDFAGLGAGVAYTHNVGMNWFIGLEMANGPSTGWQFGNNSDHSLAIGCASTGHAGAGFQTTSSAGGSLIAYCKFTDNGGLGISSQLSNTAFPVFYRCTAHDNNAAVAIGQVSLGVHLGGLYYKTNAGSAMGVMAEGGSGSDAYLLDCVLACLGDTADVNALQGTRANFVLNTIITGFVNSIGSGIGALSVAANTEIIGGNVFYDNTTNISGTHDVDFDGGAPDTTNPAFTSSTDFTPTADLSGIALWEKIEAEANWIVPGAITPSGGGGGTTVIKRGPRYHNV
jgi:hypothetical protein